MSGTVDPSESHLTSQPVAGTYQKGSNQHTADTLKSAIKTIHMPSSPTSRKRNTADKPITVGYDVSVKGLHVPVAVTFPDKKSFDFVDKSKIQQELQSQINDAIGANNIVPLDLVKKIADGQVLTIDSRNSFDINTPQYKKSKNISFSKETDSQHDSFGSICENAQQISKFTKEQQRSANSELKELEIKRETLGFEATKLISVDSTASKNMETIQKSIDTKQQEILDSQQELTALQRSPLTREDSKKRKQENKLQQKIDKVSQKIDMENNELLITSQALKETTSLLQEKMNQVHGRFQEVFTGGLNGSSSNAEETSSNAENISDKEIKQLQKATAKLTINASEGSTRLASQVQRKISLENQLTALQAKDALGLTGKIRGVKHKLERLKESKAKLNEQMKKLESTKDTSQMINENMANKTDEFTQVDSQIVQQTAIKDGLVLFNTDNNIIVDYTPNIPNDSPQVEVPPLASQEDMSGKNQDISELSGRSIVFPHQQDQPTQLSSDIDTLATAEATIPEDFTTEEHDSLHSAQHDAPFDGDASTLVANETSQGEGNRESHVSHVNLGDHHAYTNAPIEASGDFWSETQDSDPQLSSAVTLEEDPGLPTHNVDQHPGSGTGNTPFSFAGEAGHNLDRTSEYTPPSTVESTSRGTETSSDSLASKEYTSPAPEVHEKNIAEKFSAKLQEKANSIHYAREETSDMAFDADYALLTGEQKSEPLLRRASDQSDLQKGVGQVYALIGSYKDNGKDSENFKDQLEEFINHTINTAPKRASFKPSNKGVTPEMHEIVSKIITESLDSAILSIDVSVTQQEEQGIDDLDNPLPTDVPPDEHQPSQNPQLEYRNHAMKLDTNSFTTHSSFSQPLPKSGPKPSPSQMSSTTMMDGVVIDMSEPSTQYQITTKNGTSILTAEEYLDIKGKDSNAVDSVQSLANNGMQLTATTTSMSDGSRLTAKVVDEQDQSLSLGGVAPMKFGGMSMQPGGISIGGVSMQSEGMSMQPGGMSMQPEGMSIGGMSMPPMQPMPPEMPMQPSSKPKQAFSSSITVGNNSYTLTNGIPTTGAKSGDTLETKFTSKDRKGKTTVLTQQQYSDALKDTKVQHSSHHDTTDEGVTVAHSAIGRTHQFQAITTVSNNIAKEQDEQANTLAQGAKEAPKVKESDKESSEKSTNVFKRKSEPTHNSNDAHTLDIKLPDHDSTDKKALPENIKMQLGSKLLNQAELSEILSTVPVYIPKNSATLELLRTSSESPANQPLDMEAGAKLYASTVMQKFVSAQINKTAVPNVARLNTTTLAGLKENHQYLTIDESTGNVIIKNRSIKDVKEGKSESSMLCVSGTQREAVSVEPQSIDTDSTSLNPLLMNPAVCTAKPSAAVTEVLQAAHPEWKPEIVDNAARNHLITKAVDAGYNRDGLEMLERTHKVLAEDKDGKIITVENPGPSQLSKEAVKNNYDFAAIASRSGLQNKFLSRSGTAGKNAESLQDAQEHLLMAETLMDIKKYSGNQLGTEQVKELNTAISDSLAKAKEDIDGVAANNPYITNDTSNIGQLSHAFSTKFRSSSDKRYNDTIQSRQKLMSEPLARMIDAHTTNTGLQTNLRDSMGISGLHKKTYRELKTKNAKFITDYENTLYDQHVEGKEGSKGLSGDEQPQTEERDPRLGELATDEQSAPAPEETALDGQLHTEEVGDLPPLEGFNTGEGTAPVTQGQPIAAPTAAELQQQQLQNFKKELAQTMDELDKTIVGLKATENYQEDALGLAMAQKELMSNAFPRDPENKSQDIELTLLMKSRAGIETDDFADTLNSYITGKNPDITSQFNDEILAEAQAAVVNKVAECMDNAEKQTAQKTTQTKETTTEEKDTPQNQLVEAIMTKANELNESADQAETRAQDPLAQAIFTSITGKSAELSKSGLVNITKAGAEDRMVSNILSIFASKESSVGLSINSRTSNPDYESVLIATLTTTSQAMASDEAPVSATCIKTAAAHIVECMDNIGLEVAPVSKDIGASVEAKKDEVQYENIREAVESALPDSLSADEKLALSTEMTKIIEDSVLKASSNKSMDSLISGASVNDAGNSKLSAAVQGAVIANAGQFGDKLLTQLMDNPTLLKEIIDTAAEPIKQTIVEQNTAKATTAEVTPSTVEEPKKETAAKTTAAKTTADTDIAAATVNQVKALETLESKLVKDTTPGTDATTPGAEGTTAPGTEGTTPGTEGTTAPGTEGTTPGADAATPGAEGTTTPGTEGATPGADDTRCRRYNNTRNRRCNTRCSSYNTWRRRSRKARR